MNAYYNEYDPKAAAWLRKLIKAGQIAPGFVDERSITEVDPEYVKLFTQAHFFAGIGGWSYALRLAGWPDDRPVWTGSPPCQPFSNAGKQKAQADARHLWPVFFNLIRECRPANIFGEQVEAAIRTGWLDDLQDDLEAENYATGKIVLPACGVGAPHIRQRIWFVAERLDKPKTAERGELRNIGELGTPSQTGRPSSIGGLGNTNNERSQRWAGMPSADELAIGSGSLVDGLADTNGKRRGGREGVPDWGDHVGADARRQQGHDGSQRGDEAGVQRAPATDAPDGLWSAPDWLYCRDGKWRPVESGTFPLAHGLPERVGLLRGYGNAIVPQVAAEVIKAYMEAGYEL